MVQGADRRHLIVYRGVLYDCCFDTQYDLLCSSDRFKFLYIQPQDGRVIDQSPGGGTTVEEGSTVVITVGIFQSSGGSTPP